MRFTTHVDVKNVGLHGTHNKIHTLFSWNYQVGSADGGDDGDDVDFEHTDGDGSFDFQGKKTTVKALNLMSYVPTTRAIAIRYVVSML